jgi:predicted flap endonuclease-1-like 5' DNA nuclease
MSTWAWWLVLGVLLGWLVEWVIDWVYWRRAATVAVAAHGSETPRLSTLESSPSAPSQREAAALREALAGARADGERLRAELDAARASFQDEQRVSSELRSTADTLRAENDQLRIAVQAAQRAARDAQQDQAAPADVATDAPGRPTVQLNPKGLLARGSEPAPLHAEGQRDPLIDINGIGPVYQQRLFEAGVTTFDALAALSPERIRAIIKHERWQEIDPEAWIAEARQLAERQRSKQP